jgi:PST family polysaccharide transporter
MALGKTKLLFIRQVIAVFIKIPLIVGGLIGGGLIGAALGRLVSEVITVMIELLFLRHLLHISVAHQVKHHGLTICGRVSRVFGVFVIDLMLAAADNGVLVELVAKILAGGVFYAGAICAGWLATGRPEGPVTEVVTLVRRLAARRKSRHQPEGQVKSADHRNLPG